MKGRQVKKARLISILLVALISVADADLTLTVNGFDASNSVEIEPNVAIVISVSGANDANESYSVTCEEGCALEVYQEPNAADQSSYVFTFEDEALALPIVNLTVAGKLDYQLAFFIIPDTNTIVFGIDSDMYEAPEPAAQIEPSATKELNISTMQLREGLASVAESRPSLSGYLRDIRENRSKYLMHCSVDSNSRMEKPSKAAYETYGEDYFLEGDGGMMLLDSNEPNIIWVDSDITTNQIWTANNVYYVTALVNVQALLVIEPGTTIVFSYYGALLVNNGGTLISKGTPDALIIYTTDQLYPEWGYYWEYIDYGSCYICPIYIEQTASPSTTITYNFIEAAQVGILTDNVGLDHPIENNYLFGNIYGIVEYGPRHTDIQNNLCFCNYDSGIVVHLSSGDANSIADANSIITIQSNTCDYYHDYGITVHGVPDINDAGVVLLVNNIVSESYQYGLNLVDDYMYATVANTGYYDNDYYGGSNKNWEFQEYNPVEANAFPYVEVPDGLGYCYLDQNCPFIDAGLGYIEETPLIGKTTDVNSFPDSNYTDIGFHYPNWNFSNPGSGDSLSADFDDNMTVDFEDFAVFAGYWQQPTSTEADLDGNGFVDCNDIELLANQWLQLADPNIQIHLYGDPNNGYVDIGVTGQSPDTMRIFLLANGQIIGGTFGFRDDSITIDISKYGDGVQKFKVVSVDSNSHITCSNITDVEFSRTLNYCILPKTYERNQPLPFAAYNSGAENITAKVYANGGNLVWSQTYSGNSIFDSIPASITNQYEFDYVCFDNNSGQSLAKKVTDPNLPDFSENVQALIVLPKWKFRIRDYQIVWAVKDAFKSKGIIYATLSGSNATYEKVLWYAQNKHIKYLYIGCTDGEYSINTDGDDEPDNRRTNFELYDPQGGDENYELIVSIQREDYSDPNMAPSWCCDLWYRGLNSVASMGFTYLEFAYFDCCYSGHLKIDAHNDLVQGQPGQQGIFDIPHSDMSFALGMAGSGRSNFYQGWYDKAKSAFAPPPIWETEYQRWSRIEWYKLEEGMNLYDALFYVIDQQYYFGPLDPVNCYRLKGQGFLEDIYLRNW